MATQATSTNQEPAMNPPANAPTTAPVNPGANPPMNPAAGPAPNPGALVATNRPPQLQPEPDSEPDPPGLTEASPSLAEEIEARIAGAPLMLEVRLPIRNLRVKDILALEKGKIYETSWPADEDVPAGCAGVQLVWTEFEVIEKRLAVRVTRLA